MNEIQKRYQRMKFMGIPTMEMSEFEQANDNERILRMNQGELKDLICFWDFQRDSFDCGG